MIPERFWQPWAEIDPSGGHGGLPGELGEFVGARLGDNPSTKNIDLITVFGAVRDSAASLSMHPQSHMEGPPTRNMVEETLRALNWINERILDRTKTSSTRFFTWTHATPPLVAFCQRPVRFPLRNEYMHGIIYHLLGELVEIAENNANALHANLDPSSAQRILDPLIHCKSNILKDWFDKECAGEITLDELQTLFESVARPGPTIVPPGLSQDAPDGAAVAEALSGADVLQWYPSEADWTVFGRKHTELYKPERIWQPEAALGTTEDVAPERPVATPNPVSVG